jgi:hypothetical protein
MGRAGLLLRGRRGGEDRAHSSFLPWCLLKWGAFLQRTPITRNEGCVSGNGETCFVEASKRWRDRSVAAAAFCHAIAADMRPATRKRNDRRPSIARRAQPLDEEASALAVQCWWRGGYRRERQDRWALRGLTVPPQEALCNSDADRGRRERVTSAFPAARAQRKIIIWREAPTSMKKRRGRVTSWTTCMQKCFASKRTTRRRARSPAEVQRLVAATSATRKEAG